MQLFGNFKNPEELESDGSDDLLVEEEVMEQGNDLEDESASDVSWDDNEDPESSSDSESDASFDSVQGMYNDDDDSMTESDEDENKTKSNKRSQTNETTAAKETPNASSTSRKTKYRESDGAAGSSAAGTSKGSNLNEAEEEDDTVKAMIAAIKKPRTVPPTIDLDDFITDICFHPTMDYIAIGTITGDVAIYKYANEENTLIKNVEIHAKAVRDVEFTADGRDLLTCSKDKSIMVTDMETEKLKKFYEAAHDNAINKLYVIDESIFATGDDVGMVKLWDLRSKDPIFSLREVEHEITQMLTNENKKLLLLTSADGYLTTINIGARKLFVQSEPYEEEVTCMGIYRGESKLVTGTSKGNLYTYNWGQFGYHCDMYPGLKMPMDIMVPLTDRIGCVAGEDGIIRAVHIAPFKNLGIVGQHNMPVEAMDINWTGELIASSSHNNDVSFWNVKYFEDFADVKYNEKHNNYKDRRHNLPSSKVKNPGDFFADLNKPADDNDDGDKDDDDDDEDDAE